jgi:diamine N-acetyltransferase
VTKLNLRDVLALTVAPGQERFVASNAVSIAQAYFEREAAWFRAVYAGETPVGFVMLEIDAAKGEYHLWRFMIDQRFQRLGFGARAIERVVDEVRNRPGSAEVSLSYVPGEGCPGPFYEKLGFEATGEVLDCEVIMRRRLWRADGARG